MRRPQFALALSSFAVGFSLCALLTSLLNPCAPVAAGKTTQQQLTPRLRLAQIMVAPPPPILWPPCVIERGQPAPCVQIH